MLINERMVDFYSRALPSTPEFGTWYNQVLPLYKKIIKQEYSDAYWDAYRQKEEARRRTTRLLQRLQKVTLDET